MGVAVGQGGPNLVSVRLKCAGRADFGGDEEPRGASGAVGSGPTGRLPAALFWRNRCNRSSERITSAVGVAAEAQGVSTWERSVGLRSPASPLCRDPLHARSWHGGSNRVYHSLFS